MTSLCVAQKPPAIYAIPNTGLEFAVPKGWKKVVTKRETKFTFATPNSGGTATVHLVAISFRAEIDRWNAAQRDIANELHQDILEQSQEELLSVPLLLSKAKGEKGTVLTGLVYTQAQMKLLFRLESSDAAAPEAEDIWRKALLTMQTVSGMTPIADDPSKKLANTPASFAVKAPPVTVIGEIKPPKAYKGSVELKAKVALRDVLVRMPKGWSYAVDPKGGYAITGPSEAPSGLNLTVLSSLDGDPPLTAILKLSAISLDKYAKVNVHDERDGVRNAAAASVNKIWRTGTSASGPLETLEASVANGDFYVVLQGSFPGGLMPSQKAAVEDFLSHLGVEVGA